MFLLFGGQQMILLRRMRLLESVLVAMLERKVPILLVARSLLLEILLGIMFNSAGVSNFASRGASSPAFSPIQCACRSSGVRP
jgi:hypothetical protein